MRYTSTRSASISCSFEEALTSGYASDGGLFVPENLPMLSLKDYQHLTYPELAFAIMRQFIARNEVPDEDLKSILDKSYSEFDDLKHVVPVRPLVDKAVFIAELFHSPTFCFKDLGMNPVIQLLAYFSKKQEKVTSLIVSTTGDTGPAAIHAVSLLPPESKKFLNILVHYPLGQISDFQRKQLTTIVSSNTHVVAFEGGGDDMDRPIKNIHKLDSSICGINSYNIGRPLFQLIHFVWIYLRVAETLDLDISKTKTDASKIDFIIPTGAMGNITGGYMAKCMGLPVGLFNAGVNTNDITHRTFQTGKFYKSAAMEKTLSEAINIQVPYNFERILYFITDRDSELIEKWMKVMDNTKRLDIDAKTLERLQSEFQSARVDDNEMCEAARSCFQLCKYIMDPNTAVGYSAAEKLKYIPVEYSSPSNNVLKKSPSVILATASPCKFQHSVSVALGDEIWKNYFDSEAYPKNAKDILSKEEKQPTVYPFDKSLTLVENQDVWIEMAVNILKSLKASS